MFSKPSPNEKLVSVITGAVTGENIGKNLTTGATGIEKKKMLPGQAEKNTGNNVKKNAMKTGRQSCLNWEAMILVTEHYGLR